MFSSSTNRILPQTTTRKLQEQPSTPFTTSLRLPYDIVVSILQCNLESDAALIHQVTREHGCPRLLPWMNRDLANFSAVSSLWTDAGQKFLANQVVITSERGLKAWLERPDTNHHQRTRFLLLRDHSPFGWDSRWGWSGNPSSKELVTKVLRRSYEVHHLCLAWIQDFEQLDILNQPGWTCQCDFSGVNFRNRLTYC